MSRITRAITGSALASATNAYSASASCSALACRSTASRSHSTVPDVGPWVGLISTGRPYNPSMRGVFAATASTPGGSDMTPLRFVLFDYRIAPGLENGHAPTGRHFPPSGMGFGSHPRDQGIALVDQLAERIR